MAADEVTIKVLPSHIDIDFVRRGQHVHKTTSLDNLQEVLARTNVQKSPLFPGQWGMQKFLKSGQHEIYVLTTEPGIREVAYDYVKEHDDGEDEYESKDVDTFKIPVPALCWIFLVDHCGSRVVYRNGSVHAIKGPLMSEDQQLFRCPFPNTNDTWICWGSEHDQPEGTSPKSITSWPTRFFSNPFNNDLSDDKFRSFTPEGINLFKGLHLFNYMDKKLKEDESFTFPSDILIPTRRFDEMLNSVSYDFLN